MKSIKNIFATILFAAVFIGFSGLSVINAQSQCELTKNNGQGFSTTIMSVVEDCDGGFQIQVRVEHNGCPGPGCKELSNFSVEAEPGTYSDVSVSDIVGDFSFSNLDMGPNLGAQVPFEGFKIDGTSGLGDGQAGSFVINYTLTELQDQQFGAKAGPGNDIASFSKSDFEDFLICAGTGCGSGEVLNKFPAQGPGTLAYEDLWPSQGDYDFNDVVIDYQFEVTTNNANFVNKVEATFVLRAFGAGFRNGFGFQLSDAINSSDLTVSGYSLTENYITLSGNGTEAGQSQPTIIVFDNAYNQMQHPGTGIGVNTDPNAPFVTPDTLNITIEFPADTYTYADLDIAAFRPFIISNGDRGREVHLPGNHPTDLADHSWFGKSDDDSDAASNRWYVNENNLPWAINIIESFDYPTEKTDIINAHLKFVDWAQSGGVAFPDWFKDLPGYRNDANIYDKD